MEKHIDNSNKFSNFGYFFITKRIIMILDKYIRYAFDPMTIFRVNIYFLIVMISFSFIDIGRRLLIFISTTLSIKSIIICNKL